MSDRTRSTPPPNETPAAYLERIFPPPRSDEDDGLLKYEIKGRTALISYQDWPLGLFSYEKEVSHNWTNRFKEVFGNSTHFDTLKVLIKTPWDTKLGERTYLPAVKFMLTRELYESITWDNFLPENLLDVAPQVEWVREQ